jgi:hypothetical protein
MSTILHILNGDATAHGFKDTGLEGEILIWREILSQGPLLEDISSDAFWKMREGWLSQTFNTKTDDFVKQLKMLNTPYNEINLWFEFDLHCQVNLLGVMTMLTKRTDLSPPAIYLICPDDYPGKKNFRGMGELNSEELEFLYNNIRVQLTEVDFYIAGIAWKLYASGSVTVLEDWLKTNSFWGNLSLLKPALHAHLDRMRLNENGLNAIEQKLLDIYNSGIKMRLIYSVFWQTEKIYGMGDLEINLYLKSLSDKQLIDFKI